MNFIVYWSYIRLFTCYIYVDALFFQTDEGKTTKVELLPSGRGSGLPAPFLFFIIFPAPLQYFSVLPSNFCLLFLLPAPK